MATSRPLYIALEGLEGCGKSTVAYLLSEALEPVVLTRENGGTDIGQEIRKITHGNLDMEPETEMLLFLADRVQHIAEVVEPALESGRHVVSDRSMFSSLAYQGGGRGLGWRSVLDMHDILRIRRPDVVFYLKAGDAIRSQRRTGRDDVDRIEGEDSGFFQRVGKTFDGMAESKYPDLPIWPINAEYSADHVLGQIGTVLKDNYGLELQHAH